MIVESFFLVAAGLLLLLAALSTLLALFTKVQQREVTFVPIEDESITLETDSIESVIDDLEV